VLQQALLTITQEPWVSGSEAGERSCGCE
jgi:hypothetical protein